MLPKFKEEQPRLFAEPIGNHGHVRTVIGDFAEALTAKLFKGRRYRTDSRSDYCPDVKALDTYFEVKAVGRTKHTFIYQGRLEKDLAFSRSNKLAYVFWCHNIDSKFCYDSFELRCMFLATLTKILVVPFEVVYETARLSPVTKLNSKYGHSDTNPIYGAGYRIPISRIMKFPHTELVVRRSEELFC